MKAITTFTTNFAIFRQIFGGELSISKLCLSMHLRIPLLIVHQWYKCGTCKILNETAQNCRYFMAKFESKNVITLERDQKRLPIRLPWSLRFVQGKVLVAPISSSLFAGVKVEKTIRGRNYGAVSHGRCRRCRGGSPLSLLPFV